MFKAEKGMWNPLLSDEFNKIVDEWAEGRNALRGEMAYPTRIGNVPNPYAPTREMGSNNFYSLFNELITKDLIRHFCDAIGCKNPLYRWEEYAKFTKYGQIIAPPGILYVIGEAGAGRGVVAPGFGRSLAGGSTWTWYKIIKPGDSFHVKGVDMGVTEKQVKPDKPYRLYRSCYRTEYYNQNDELVASRDRTRMNIVAENLQKTKSAFKEKERHKYTQEELDEIHQAYYDEDKYRRGSEPLFFEDVAVGQKITPVAAGPLNVLDGVVMMGAMGQQAAFNVQWDMLNGNIETHGWIDPETNAPRWRAEGHTTDLAARSTGLSTGAYGYHGQTEALFQKAIINWIGDEGFLKIQSSRTLRPNWHGDVTWINGVVTAMRQENGECLVDFELTAVNQDGEMHQDSTATAILPSRNRLIE